ncbi:MAG TPA: ABC transporter permease [Puia sp.]|nr:ABC transporter permease [Puia sp.]
MFSNYFKTAWRNLTKHRAYSFINIAGLSAGLAVTMLIGLWIWDEFSFDKNFDNYPRIAQVMQTETLNGMVKTDKGNVMPLAAELRKNYSSNFKRIALSTWTMNSLVASGDKKINTQGNYMEYDAPDMLSLKMLAGSRRSFNAPSTMLISHSIATALYGKDDPIGKTITIGGDIREKVVGVYEDFPESCSFKETKFIAPFRDLKSWVDGNENNWYNESFQVFVEIADDADMAAVSQKIRDVKLNKIDARTARLEKPAMVLHPMSRWHLYSEFRNGVNTGGAIRYVWMFAIVGVFVLLLACINFMNLSTARSERRAKEVGIRKAIGSLRGQLINQFFSESMLVAILSFVFSILLVILVLPFFNDVSGKQMSIPWGNIYFWAAGVGITLFTGLLAGVYPALYLSSFRPVKVLKGSFKAGRFAAMPRRVLVVTQFTVSVILIIGTIVVFRQVQFAKSRPVGYTRQGLVTIVMQTYNFHNHFANMRNDLLQQGVITDMAESNTPVTENDHFSNGFNWEGKDPQISAKFNIVSATQEYGNTVGFELLDGRDFSKEFGNDSAAMIINATAARYIGFKQPIGKTIKLDGNKYTIIGVVRDMVMESPYEPVKPTVYNLDNSIGGILNIKLSPNKTTTASLAALEAVCKKYSPEEPFEYKFVDETFARKFSDEERIGKLSSFFSILAIFISCLGIFGMASFMAEQRVKEIGVRKVLGASTFSLWQLLSRDFVKLVLISLLIAIPVARYFMHSWLQNYQYRTALSWWIFAAAGFGALVITLLTVSFQSIKAALANPVKSLRSE